MAWVCRMGRPLWCRSPVLPGFVWPPPLWWGVRVRGLGGQFTFGDDELGVGFAYVANRMIGHGDARANRLIAAVRECLAI